MFFGIGGGPHPASSKREGNLGVGCANIARMNLTTIEAGWLADSLRGIDLFRALSDDERRALGAAFEGLLVRGNETLLLQGQEGTRFYLIYSGRMSVWIRRNGRRRKIAGLKRGDYFGEISLLMGRPTSAEVTASAPSKVLVLDPASLKTVAAKNSAFANHAAALVRKRLHERDAAWESLGYKNADEINEAIRAFLGGPG